MPMTGAENESGRKRKFHERSLFARGAKYANAHEERGLAREHENPSGAEEPDQQSRHRDRQAGPLHAGVATRIARIRLSRAIPHERA